MVAGDVFVRDDLAANHHRVDGGAVHPTNNGAVLVPDDLAANHHRVLRRVEGSAFHALIVGGAVLVPDDLAANHHRVLRRVEGCAFHALIVTGAVHAVMVGREVTVAVQAAILPTLGEGVRV